MDPHLHRARADPVDEREGLFAGQCGRGGVLRPSQAGVLPQEELPGRDDRRVHRDARRVHGLVPRQAHQDRIRHEHHGQTHPARARRLKPSGTLTNDHTDNEVQQNVTTPKPQLPIEQKHRGRILAVVVRLRQQTVVHAPDRVPLLPGQQTIGLQPPVHQMRVRVDLRPVPAIRLRLGRAILHIRVLRDRPAIHMQTTRYLRARHSLPVESPDILHNGHRYRHVPFLPERRPAATGRIKTDWQLGNIQAAAPMPLTSPGNDDDTGENHQPTLRKNTAEPVEQTLKQNSRRPVDADQPRVPLPVDLRQAAAGAGPAPVSGARQETPDEEKGQEGERAAHPDARAHRGPARGGRIQEGVRPFRVGHGGRRRAVEALREHAGGAQEPQAVRPARRRQERVRHGQGRVRDIQGHAAGRARRPHVGQRHGGVPARAGGRGAGHAHVLRRPVQFLAAWQQRKQERQDPPLSAQRNRVRGLGPGGPRRDRRGDQRHPHEAPRLQNAQRGMGRGDRQATIEGSQPEHKRCAYKLNPGKNLVTVYHSKEVEA